MGKNINTGTGAGIRPEKRMVPYGKGKIREQMVWDITADQLEELMEKRGNVMYQALREQEKGLRKAGIDRRLSMAEIRKTARNAGGMVFIDGVEGVTDDVGNTIWRVTPSED